MFAAREALVALLHYPSPQAFEQGMDRLFLAWKTAFPRGTIDVLRIHTRSLTDPLLIRVLTLVPLLPVSEITQILENSPVHATSSLHFFRPEPHYELIANLGFPRTFAFGVRLGPEAYFIMDYGQDITIDAVEWSERRARDMGANILSPQGAELHTKSFPDTSLPARHFLRTWVTGRLCYLFCHLTDLHTAVDEAGNLVDPTGLWKDLLTLKDILGLTQLVASASDPSVIRLLFFDLIDRYGQLGGRPKRNADRILSAEFIEGLARNLDPGLHGLRAHVQEYLMDAWNRFVEGIWEGIYSDDARDARVLNLSPPGQPQELLTGANVASKYAWVYRNTTHGYHLDSRAFEKYLIRHSGEVPNSVRELSIALWLGLLSSPERFWPDPSRFEHMEAYSVPPPPIFRSPPAGSDPAPSAEP